MEGPIIQDRELQRKIKPIVHGFFIFVISAILIYVALNVVNTLFPNFPLDNSSYEIIAILLGIFITFISTANDRAKKEISKGNR